MCKYIRKATLCSSLCGCVGCKNNVKQLYAHPYVLVLLARTTTETLEYSKRTETDDDEDYICETSSEEGAVKKAQTLKKILLLH